MSVSNRRSEAGRIASLGLSRAAPHLVAALLLASVAACGAPAPAPESQEAEAVDVAAGRQVAKTHCATCHAIERGQKSPRPDAPALSTLLDDYDTEVLAADFIEGVRVGHDGMPIFDLSVMDTDALVAYLRSINTSGKPADGK